MIGSVILIPLIIGVSYSFQSIEFLNPFVTGCASTVAVALLVILLVYAIVVLWLGKKLVKI